MASTEAGREAPAGDLRLLDLPRLRRQRLRVGVRVRVGMQVLAE